LLWNGLAYYKSGYFFPKIDSDEYSPIKSESEQNNDEIGSWEESYKILFCKIF
jgi:hypothetical protein